MMNGIDTGLRLISSHIPISSVFLSLLNLTVAV